MLRPAPAGLVPGSLRPSELAWIVPAAIFAAGVGVVVAAAPLLGAALGALLLLGALALRAPIAVERGATLFLIGGVFVLGYGFANLGLKTGAAPIPLAEVILLPLAAIAIFDGRTRAPARVLVPLGLYLCLLMIRLFLDYPTYGTDAIRDVTTGVEALMILVAYRAAMRDGLGRWTLLLGIIFGCVLLYASAYPWREQFGALGPTVGLQRPIPLFSMVGANFATVAAGLFFAVFTRGWVRIALLGWVVGLVGLFQERGLYLLLPAAVIVLGWAVRRPVRVMAGAVISILIGVLMLSWVGGIGVEGRLGPVQPEFYSTHLGTLLGRSGPGAGSLADRGEWTRKTLEELRKTPGSLAFGIGLGPDLTFGFRLGGEISVRKPHNDHLETLARTGIVGSALFMWLIVAALIPIARTARQGGTLHARVCAWALATSIFYLGVAAVQPVLAFPYGTIPLFLMLGLGLAAARTEGPD